MLEIFRRRFALQRGRRPRTPERNYDNHIAARQRSLQRGRRPRTPERPHRGRDVLRGHRASMGPASEDAGNRPCQRRRSSAAIPASMGPASETPEMAADFGSGQHRDASMGPRSEDAGESRQPVAKSTSAGVLRWGRRPRTPEIERRPGWRRPTRPPLLQRGRRPRTPESHRGTELRTTGYCNRAGPRTPERCSRQLPPLRHHPASTGPASEDAGEGADYGKGLIAVASTGPASEDAGESHTPERDRCEVRFDGPRPTRRDLDARRPAQSSQLQRGRRPRTPESEEKPAVEANK